MNLAALFSGGKDSTFAIFKARSQGHTVSCLVTIFPKSEESHLLHHPNVQLTRLQAKLMNLPQIAVGLDSDDTELEVAGLKKALASAKEQYGIEGVVHGGIKSAFQKKHFESACSALGLAVVSPLWNIDEAEYLRELVRSGFHCIITSVTAEGLDESWLGREMTAGDVERLIAASSRHGLNPSFEGGEAETFVVSCPLFSGRIEIIKSSKTWDGYRGRFEITETALEG